MDKRTGRQMDRLTNGWSNGRTDERIDGMDSCTENRFTDARIDEWSYGWTYDQMDNRTGLQKDGRLDVDGEQFVITRLLCIYVYVYVCTLWGLTRVPLHKTNIP